MIKVFEDFDLARVGHFQSVLAASGIRTLLKNQFMSSVMGEIPFVEVLPELWIIDDRDLSRAQELIRDLLARPLEDLPDWTCGNCGTEVASVFSHCWNCGRANDD
jgi:lipopolysaccharide biosynthesis regulator YciM